MAKLIVPQEGEQELGAAQSETVQLALARQRQRDTVQSLVSSVILVGLLIAVLALLNEQNRTIRWGASPAPGALRN